jgi:hypothetical protein
MNNNLSFQDMPVWLTALIFFLIFWEMIWKLIALWKSARNDHKAWFIVIGIINSVGIIPIIYLLINKKKKELT